MLWSLSAITEKPLSQEAGIGAAGGYNTAVAHWQRDINLLERII